MKLKRIDTRLIKTDYFGFSIENGQPVLDNWDREKKKVTPLFKGEKAKDTLIKKVNEYIKELADDEVVLFHIEKAKMEEVYEL